MDINTQRPTTPTTATPSPRSTAPATGGRRSLYGQSKNSRLIRAIIASIVVLAVLGALVWFGWKNVGGNSGLIDNNRYQAVFLANGQVYFGKLKDNRGEYLVLRDVFYLQAANSTPEQSDNPQDASQGQGSGDLQLIKLGTEVHGPDDEMIISRSQMLFFENLQGEGRVSESIREFNESQD